MYVCGKGVLNSSEHSSSSWGGGGALAASEPPCSSRLGPKGPSQALRSALHTGHHYSLLDFRRTRTLKIICKSDRHFTIRDNLIWKPMDGKGVLRTGKNMTGVVFTAF